MKYGYIAPVQKPEDYVFGAGKLPEENLQPDGQWDAYIPEGELQNLNNVEPFACVTFGTFNAAETLIKRKYGIVENFSDRFTAKQSGTEHAPGNDPHTVGEYIRKQGAVREPLWPIGPNITTFAQFYAALPIALTIIAERFLSEWEFKHEYVPTTHAALKEALKHSPLGFSVYGWAQEANGIYFNPPGLAHNHWCMCYGYEEGKYWKILDSYTNTHKKVGWNDLPQAAKRYYVTRSTRPQQISLYKQIILKLQAILVQLQTTKRRFGAVGTTLESLKLQLYKALIAIKLMGNRLILYETAKASLGRDASPLDRANDALGCAESVNAIHKKAFGFEIGGSTSTALLFEALVDSPYFDRVSNPLPGDVIISPTGSGNGRVAHGHTGIVAKQGIMSNDSDTGTWELNYTMDMWKRYYGQKGGFIVAFFRRK